MDGTSRHHAEGARSAADAGTADRVEVRPLTSDDQQRLADAFAPLAGGFRPRTSSAVPKWIRQRDLDRLIAIDHRHGPHAAIARDSGQILGIAGYVTLPEDPQSAEVAIAVDDDWQGRGVARRLLTELTRHARAQGVTRLLAYVATNNPPVRGWIARVGGIAIDHYGDEILYRISLESPFQERAVA